MDNAVPPVEYVEYYLYANLAQLNDLREARKLKAFAFLPFVSSKAHSSPRQLAIAFLLGEMIGRRTEVHRIVFALM